MNEPAMNGTPTFCGKARESRDLRVYCNGNLGSEDWPSHGTCGARFFNGFVAHRLMCLDCAKLAGLIW